MVPLPSVPALSVEQERLFLVPHRPEGFQMTQIFIGAPVFCEFNGATSEVAMVLFQFRFEAAEKGEGVGGGAGESGEDLIVIKAANFLRSMFNDGLTERNL